MNADLALPLITSLGWLILCGAALMSYRLRWKQFVKLALIWAAIFGGVFVAAGWIMASSNGAESLIHI